MSNAWRIELLGKLQAVQDDRVISHFETRKTGALLSLLALSLPRACSRELLLERLWPDEDPEMTRMRLRQALAALRRVLEPAGDDASKNNFLLTDRLQVQLSPQSVTTDVAAFEVAVQSAARAGSVPERVTHLQQALALYGGELLPGYYEEFILSERRRLAETHRDALVALSAALSEMGDPVAAIKAAKQAVSVDPTDEEAHATLMRAYAAAGRPSEALRQARELERMLRRI